MKATLKNVLIVSALSLISIAGNAAVIQLSCGAKALDGSPKVSTNFYLSVNTEDLSAKGQFDQVQYGPIVTNSIFYQDLQVQGSANSLKVLFAKANLKLSLDLPKAELNEIILGKSTQFTGGVQVFSGPIIPLANELSCKVDDSQFEIGNGGVEPKTLAFIASLNLEDTGGHDHIVSAKSYKSAHFNLNCLQTAAHTSHYGSFGPATRCYMTHPTVRSAGGQFSWVLNGDEASDLQRVLGSNSVTLPLDLTTNNQGDLKVKDFTINCPSSDRCVILVK